MHLRPAPKTIRKDVRSTVIRRPERKQKHQDFLFSSKTNVKNKGFLLNRTVITTHNITFHCNSQHGKKETPLHAENEIILTFTENLNDHIKDRGRSFASSSFPK